MLVSLNVIKKYISLDDLTPEQIANGLTFTGIRRATDDLSDTIFLS